MGKKTLSKETVDTEKPALSLCIPFLSYIAKVLFSVFVFFIFLLVTWGLHYLGNTLVIVGTVSWGIFEILVISFGTLLCVLFFIKATAKFLPKLIRHLWKPSKQTDGIPSRLQPWDIAKSFLEPLHKQHRVFFGCSVLTIIVLLYVGISFAEIVRDSSDDVSILACEMLCETGPDFPKSVSDGGILEMLASYSKYLEHKYLPNILRVFTDSPMKGLASASQIVGNINIKGGQEKAANDIWRAGEEIMLGRLKAPKFLPRGIALHEYREAPEELVNDVNDALNDSEEAARLFEEKKSLENAVESCEANRKTMVLLFLIRSSYNTPKVAPLFTRFRTVVEASRNSKSILAGKPPYIDSRKEFLKEIISESEQRRIDILECLENRNIQEAIEHMWDAIEIAYSRRAELLELCENIRSAGNYSFEIIP